MILFYTLKGQLYTLQASLFVADLNSTLLETKVTKIIDLGYTSNGMYEVLNASEFKYLISIGDTEHKEQGFLVHDCFGIMMSTSHALTIRSCVPYG